MHNSEHKHYPLEELVKYVCGALPEGREVDISEHLASCDTCVKTVRSIRKTGFVVDTFTAITHGEQYCREQAASSYAAFAAIKQDETWLSLLSTKLQRLLNHEASESIRKRLKHWMAMTKGTLLLALSPSSPRTAAGGQISIIPTRGDDICLSAGQLKYFAYDVCKSGQGDLVVRFQRLPGAPGSVTPPLVLLIPKNVRRTPVLGPVPSPVGEAEAESAPSLFSTRFTAKKLPSDDYIIAFEPID